MWISKKKWNELEKRITDLEGRVQCQQETFAHHSNCPETENKEFKDAIRKISELGTVIPEDSTGKYYPLEGSYGCHNPN